MRCNKVHKDNYIVIASISIFIRIFPRRHLIYITSLILWVMYSKPWCSVLSMTPTLNNTNALCTLCDVRACGGTGWDIWLFDVSPKQSFSMKIHIFDFSPSECRLPNCCCFSFQFGTLCFSLFLKANGAFDCWNCCRHKLMLMHCTDHISEFSILVSRNPFFQIC